MSSIRGTFSNGSNGGSLKCCHHEKRRSNKRNHSDETRNVHFHASHPSLFIGSPSSQHHENSRQGTNSEIQVFRPFISIRVLSAGKMDVFISRYICLLTSLPVEFFRQTYLDLPPSTSLFPSPLFPPPITALPSFLPPSSPRQISVV